MQSPLLLYILGLISIISCKAATEPSRIECFVYIDQGDNEFHTKLLKRNHIQNRYDTLSNISSKSSFESGLIAVNFDSIDSTVVGDDYLFSDYATNTDDASSFSSTVDTLAKFWRRSFDLTKSLASKECAEISLFIGHTGVLRTKLVSGKLAKAYDLWMDAVDNALLKNFRTIKVHYKLLSNEEDKSLMTNLGYLITNYFSTTNDNRHSNFVDTNSKVESTLPQPFFPRHICFLFS